MATPFFSSLRSIESDDSRHWIGWVGLAVALASAWCVWAVLAHVALYESTSEARIEVASPVHEITSAVSDQIRSVHVAVGDSVAPGQLLIELDRTIQEYEREERRAELEALERQLTGVADEGQAIATALQAARRAETAALAEARAQLREANAAAERGREDLARAKTRVEQGRATRDELEETERVAAELEAALAVRSLTVERLEREGGSRRADRMAEAAGLETQRAELESRVDVARSALARIDAELERRQIVASVAGRITDLDTLVPGSWIEAGASVGRIVPSGPLHVVAEFPETAAIRVAEGQMSRVYVTGRRPEGDETLVAQVLRVGTGASRFGAAVSPAGTAAVRSGTGPTTGRVRVELSLPGEVASRLHHGLPVSVEVEVERVRPLDLLLRVVGRAARTRRA